MYLPPSYFTFLEKLPEKEEVSRLAALLFPRVFRTDFTQPGFGLIQFDCPVDSHHLRQCMISLKEVLSDLHQQEFGSRLAYLSLGRFDQQVTAKFHLDGSPEIAFLMLGYEASGIDSQLAIADYSRAAHELGITPRQFLDDYNPIFARGERELARCVTHLEMFALGKDHILLINNSSQPYHAQKNHQLGVMHQATIPDPSGAKSRVVNSTMIGLEHDTVFAVDADHFIRTEGVVEKY